MGGKKHETKRGAGTARRARIQILSGKMSPLSLEVYRPSKGANRTPRRMESWHHREAACYPPQRLSRLTKTAMPSSHCSWVALIFLSVVTSDMGVSSRAVDSGLGFLSQPPTIGNEPYRPPLRMDALRRWRRGITEAHRERCAELAAPWVETTQPVQDNATMLRIRVRPLSPGGSQGFIFPGKALFSFVRRVYHCCQEGLHCGGVKGIQGRLSGGKIHSQNKRAT